MKSSTQHIYRHQAFTELAVSLIALLAVFAGMLLIMSVSTDSVENLIKARCDADSKAEKRSSGQAGEYIQTWNEEDVTVNMATGQESTPFTVMRKVSGTSGSPDLYMNELSVDTEIVSSAGGCRCTSCNPCRCSHDCTSSSSGSSRNLTDSTFLPDIPEKHRIDPLSGADFFVRAANLVEGTASTSDPENLFDGEVGPVNLSFLFPVKFGVLQDRVYMPANKKE